MIGAADGFSYFAKGIDGNIDEGQVFDDFIEDYLGFSVGAYSTFGISNVDEDGELDLFVGQDLGGLFYLENDSNNSAGLIDLENEPIISFWPNPFKSELFVELIDQSENITADLFNLAGEFIQSYPLSKKTNVFNLEHLDCGVYYMRLSKGRGTVKLIKF